MYSLAELGKEWKMWYLELKKGRLNGVILSINGYQPWSKKTEKKRRRMKEKLQKLKQRKGEIKVTKVFAEQLVKTRRKENLKKYM